MVKFFKIKVKIVWIIAALTIAAVLAMVFIGAFANLNKAQFDWSSYIPYFYGAAAVVVLYKIVVLYYTSFYQTEIDEKTGLLVSLDDEMKKFRANSQEGSLPDAKFEARDFSGAKWQAWQWANTRKGYWHTVHSPILTRAISNENLKRAHSPTLTEYYEKMHPR